MRQDKFQEALDQYRVQTNVAGAAAALIHEGSITPYVSGYGSLQAKEPIRSSSIFEAASLSKQILAFVVLQMVDSGMLDLDSPVLSLFSATDLIASPWHCLLRCEGFSKITIRQVLSHSTGLPNWVAPESISKLTFKSGEYFQYSGMGYLYLQWAIERHLLAPWHEIAEKNIFLPLQMGHSGFMWKDVWENDLVQGHSTSGDVKEKARFQLAGGSAGGLLTALSDYSIFCKELMLKMSDSGSVFSKMHQPQVEKIYSVRSPDKFWPIAWGLGIGLEHYGTETFVWQWGGNPYFFNWFIGNPRTQEGLLIFTNSEPGHKLPEKLISHVFGAGHPCWEFAKALAQEI
jgi:CubicO group peptidase (beta-lactamase class C family)